MNRRAALGLTGKPEVKGEGLSAKPRQTIIAAAKS
jgi:hypothetical protein